MDSEASSTGILFFFISNMKALLAIVLILIITKMVLRATHENGPKQFLLPPQPSMWPLLGGFPEMLLNKPIFRWMHRLMEDLNTEIACFRLGKTHVITVTSPKIAVEFIRKTDAVFASRPPSFASHTLSKGYLNTAFTPYGEQWKKMRRVLSSEILTPAKHSWLHDKRAEEADNIVKYLFYQCKNSKDVNVRLVGQHYCANVIRRSLFNSRSIGEPMPDGGPGKEDVKLVEALFTCLGNVYAFSICDYFPLLSGFDLDGHKKIVNEASKVIINYQEPIIDSRIWYWRHENFNDGDQKELQDLLDVFITLKDVNGKPLLTPEEIKAQCWDFMMAAVDNPSNAAEWTLAEMINQPAILEKATEELDRVVGREGLVQESDVPHLNYIKACIREAFRLHPVGAFNLPHVALSDAIIAGYFIPEGSVVLLSRYGLGRNPKVWDEPLKFKPERHLSEQCSEVVLLEPELRFITFSTGRRGCVGTMLGTTMSVMLLARLIQGFSWTKPANVSAIELAESKHDTFLARALVLHAEPRLPLHLYHVYA